MREIPAENLVFLDEASVNFPLARLFARSEKGTRARGKVPYQRGKNVSMIHAMTIHKILAKCHLLGNNDGVSFEAFVLRFLVPQLWPGACVIMDNYSIHKGEQVREFIENAGAHLIYLPPYSPEFNPIEQYWSKLKSILRQLGARTYQELVDAIDFAVEQVSPQDIHNWFTYSCYCTS